MLRRPVIVVLLLALLAITTSAHKDSSVAGSTDIEYNIGVGLIPAQIVAGEPQHFYLLVEKYGEFTPVSDLYVEFIIYKDISASLDSSDQLYQMTVKDTVGKYYGVEEEPGYYVAEHVFEKGNYIIEATLYEEGMNDNKNVIKKMTRHVVAEPRGPSPFFWLGMLVAVIIAAFVARRDA